MCEYLLLDKISNHKSLLRFENSHYLADISKTKQAVIFVFVHTGNWELVGQNLIERKFNPLFLYKPVRNRFALKLAINARARMVDENHLLEATPDAMWTIFELLAKKHAVWMAIDEYKDSQVMFPTFGRDFPDTNTNTSYAVRLAQRFDATIIPIWTRREQDLSFSIKISEPFKVAKGQQEKHQALTKLDKLVEAWIMENLDQWYMSHELRL
jgi:lauroyl/myristoyl acyltransferase